MSRYLFFLFDLDGTLTDSAPGILNGIRPALAAFGITETDNEALRRFLGPPLITAFREYYGLSEADASEAVRIFRTYYTEKGILENAPYPLVPELLRELKTRGAHLAIATSKPLFMAERVLENYGLSSYFDVVCGASPDENAKGKTDIVAQALSEIGADKSKSVMVGDRFYDLNAAKENGIDSIGVLYGYGSRDELASATHTAENVMDILHFI